ncbi:MAG: ABC transporter permease subunit [Actinomycetota bacterium]|nr:ABC transporter permease subunit [Actinomycetota bacterium]
MSVAGTWLQRIGADRANHERHLARSWPRVAWLSVLGTAVVLPFVYLALASVGPLIDQAVGSLFSWHHVHPQHFAGLTYYRQVLADSAARAAIVHTVIYVAITVPIELAVGIAGAWLIFRVRRGKGLMTALFALPLVVPWSAGAALFAGLFGVGGVLQGIRAHVFGATTPLFWNLNPWLGFAAIVAIGIWKGAPWCFLLLLAALGGCPPELFEAGRMDGGRGWSYWRHVVLPAVWPMLIFVAIFRLFAEAQMAQSVDLLTQGGPFGATDLIGSYVNGLAFTSLQFPNAEALATLTGGVLLLLALGGLVALRHPAMSPLRTRRRTGRRRLSWAGTPSAARELADAGPGAVRGARRARRPGWIGQALWWLSASEHRTRRLVAVALIAMATLELFPITGGPPGGALRPDFHLAWSQIATGLANSAVMTAGTLVGTLVLAVPAAYLLARVRIRGRAALFALVLAAMAIPGALTLFPEARALVLVGLINTRLGVILIYIAADLPIAVFFLRAAFAAVPEALVEAMRLDGASTLRVAVRLVLPLAASTLVAVGLLTVLQAWGESLVMVVMTDNQALYTLPVLVADGFGGVGTLSASWLSIGPPLVAFVVLQRHFRRGLAPGALW